MADGITNQISDAFIALATSKTTCTLGYTEAPPNTYTKKFPFWTAWPLTQHFEAWDSASVGPTEAHPHLWIMHYVIHTDRTATIDVMKAQRRMYNDIDLLQEAWGHVMASKFDGLVTSVGDQREWKHHPDGPFVQFAGRTIIGSYGVVSVVAPQIPFGCLVP